MMSFEVSMKHVDSFNSRRFNSHKPLRFACTLGVCVAVIAMGVVPHAVAVDEGYRTESSEASGDREITAVHGGIENTREGFEEPNREVWLVSSRQVSCPSENLTGLKYYRLLENQWIETPAEEFDRTSNQSRLNVFFVHGNRTDFKWASRRGLQAYDSFVASQNPGVPTRYIIWAWPSDQVSGLVTDFRIKAQRANREGHLFGNFLAGLPKDERMSLIGYSYGSRIILGGLQLLSGEKLFGRQLELPENYEPPEFRVTLIAAATGNGSLTPQATYGQAYPMMDRLLLVNNTADRALKLYKFLDRQRQISALGRGIAGRSLLEDGGERVEQFDFAKEIGHEHSLTGYFCSSRIRNLLKQQVFWMDDHGEITEAVDSGSTSR
jgi:hypothetical protein